MQTETETQKSIRRRAFSAAFPHTIPILAGFLFLGISYGLYATAAGFDFWYPILMAVVIFGGSLEFVAVEMLLGIFAPAQTLIMALMIQARHLFYGIAMLEKYKGTGWKKVYLIYGMYHCLNFVTEAKGEPAAVLIRGAVPAANGDIIAKNRFGRKMEEMSAYQRKNFLNGPGKLCRGLSLTRAQNGLDLTRPTGGLYLRPGCPPDPGRIHTGPRVGIDYAEEAVSFPWRFWIE